MNTFIKSTLFSLATLATAFFGFAVESQAQQPQAALAPQQIQNPQPVQSVVPAPAQVQPPVQATQEYYVAPVIAPQPPQPQNEYYFGFSIQLVSDAYGGKTLRIVSVTPGSPAQQAGLEIGDEIRSVNGLGFLHAPDSFVAVNMLNRFVSPNPLGGGTVPATAAGVQAYVAPGHHHQPIANMIVRNVRNGQDVAVTVRPQPRAVVMPAPAAAAATVSQ